MISCSFWQIHSKNNLKRETKLENLLKIIKQVESTHRGLGVITSFNLLGVLANQSIFNVGSSGKGKTHVIFSIIKACESLPNTVVNNWNAMTYYELVEKIGEKFNTNLVWTVEEWSMLSDYHRELLMAIASKVQTDKNFERMVKSGMYAQEIKIINCNLVLLIAIQPFKFRKLMKESDNWNSLASDRFSKFMFINPLQIDTKDFPPVFDLPSCVAEQWKYDFKPNPLLVDIFSNHFTPGRAELAALQFQKAWCRLNGIYDFTTVDAIAFKSFYSPYLDLYPLMIKATDPDTEESFYTGPFRIIEHCMRSYHSEFTIKDIQRAFHMVDSDDLEQLSQKTIYKHLKVLENKGIIQFHSPTFGLSERYVRYFDNYKENWK